MALAAQVHRWSGLIVWGCQICSIGRASGAYIGRADLRRSVLIEAKFDITILIEANLDGLDLTDMDLSSVELRNASLRGAIFCRTLTPWGQDDRDCQ